MSKHTPGPWKAETFAGRINIWPTKTRKQDRSAICYDCSEDDARLIAAAPDLYEALRRCERLLGEVTPAKSYEGSPLQQARAALAKVEA